jgi:tetratricopeptide (TPR) repeat protein
VYELSRIVDADPELITWRQGRCLAYGDGVAFWALAEVVKAQAGILERDTEPEAAEKLRVAVADAIDDVSDARWVESHLRPLVGLESETVRGGDRRSAAFAAWRRSLGALAEPRPRSHCSGTSPAVKVSTLVDVWRGGDGVASLVVAARDRSFSAPEAAGNASTSLSPLSLYQTAVLISRVLDRALLPAEIQQALLERAEGNPLYAEQFAQLYLERGSAEELPLPETLQGIVAARLDGLSAAAKALLQDAAVIGKVFWTGALRRDDREATELLHGLERKGPPDAPTRSSVRRGRVGVRAHPCATSRTGRSSCERSEAPARRRVDRVWAARRSWRDARVHHCGLRLSLRAAGLDAGDLAERTRFVLRGAGDRAFALVPTGRRGELLREVPALWPSGTTTSGLTCFGGAHSLALAGDAGRGLVFEEAPYALIAVGNRETAGEATALLARVAWHRGAQDVAISHLESAEELVAAAPASAAKARVLAISARQRTLAGEQREGLRLAEQALELAERLELAELEAHALTSIGTAKMQLGDRSGVSYMERALEIAIAANSPEAATILINLAVDMGLGGDVRREDELLGEAYRTAERFGNRDALRFSRGDRIWTRWALGHWDEAIREADAFIAECASSPHYLEGSARDVRGNLRGARGDRDGALDDCLRSLELARHVKDPQSLLPALLQAARCCALFGRIDEAQALAAEGLELAEHVEYASMLGPMLMQVVGPLGLREQVRELVEQAPDTPWQDAALAVAEGDLSRAADVYAGMGSPTLEADARLCAAEELIGAGCRAEGEDELKKALAF